MFYDNFLDFSEIEMEQNKLASFGKYNLLVWKTKDLQVQWQS